jgi:hypothetical protein
LIQCALLDSVCRMTFILLDPSRLEEHKHACADLSGTYTADLRVFDARIGPRLSGIYCEKKDATILVPMVAVRDHDQHPLVITTMHQGNAVGTVPDSYDPSSRQGPVILQVWDPVEGVYEFKEFENFVDFNTVDPTDLGCLLNNGTEQRALLKEYCVQNSVKTFFDALKKSNGFKDGVCLTFSPAAALPWLLCQCCSLPPPISASQLLCHCCSLPPPLSASHLLCHCCFVTDAL